MRYQPNREINEESEEYDRKQPRHFNAINYNFEQFREYSQSFKSAQEKEKKYNSNLNKILKYIVTDAAENNQDQGIADRWKRTLGVIPDKTSVDDSVSIQGFRPPKSRRSRRPVIRTKSSIQLEGYDGWRVFDRNLQRGSDKERIHARIMVPPYLLVRAFGEP